MPITDTSALLRWLSTHLADVEGPLTLSRFVGGQSNPTYAVQTRRARYVLRRKPAGPLLPSAHQIEREYRVLGALASTGVPVPGVFALCEDPSILGAPFFIMEYLDGRVFSDPALPDVAPAERTAIYESALAVLAQLHRVDFRSVGLDDFGRAEGYLARQVSRWTKQYRASQTDAIASMDALIEWLPAHLPTDDEATIAHGDYRLGNLIFGASEPRVIGILDWELATIGHPLLDVAYAVLMHEMPAGVLRGMGGSIELAHVAGVPSAERLIAVYSEHAQRPRPKDFRFFLALAFFRSAAIMQGIRHRIGLGNAAGGPGAELRAAATPGLADLGWNTVRQASL